MTSISPGLIDVRLHLRVDVFGIGQIELSGFQALMAKPGLDVHQVDAVPEPAGRASLTQPVEVVFLADRACGTCNLRGLPQMIFPLLDRRSAVPAVQPGTLGYGLELAEEVALRVSIGSGATTSRTRTARWFVDSSARITSCQCDIPCLLHR